MCKRLVEFELRRLDRRLEKYALEQREVKANPEDWPDEEERQKRLRALRRWIRQDEERMRELIGASRNNQNAPAWVSGSFKSISNSEWQRFRERESPG